jgi:outer membrane immunogenic protein
LPIGVRDNDWLRLTGDDRREIRVFDWSVAMRRLVLAVMIFGAASGARAADLPDLPILRGGLSEGLSTSTVNWEGFYVGGQAGYGSSDENFNGSTSTMAAALLADTLIESAMQVSQWNLALGKNSSRSSSYGGFVGYNWQWEDVVVGLEASYLHGTFGGMASGTEARTSTAVLADNYFHSVTATSQSAIAISDMATFRGRAGYAYGCFLPYMFGGLALGNANITRTFTVTDVAFANNLPTIAFAPLTSTDAQHNHLLYGYSAGLGVDINLVGGLFMRAEWEYTRFAAAVDTSINTVRAGLGYKF